MSASRTQPDEAAGAVQVVEETPHSLTEYAAVPIAFRVTSRFQVEPDLRLVEEAVTPYLKDYDALAEEGPLSWPRRWDIRNWGILAARAPDGRQVGGAVIAWNTPGVDLLQGRDDLAVLWDLRVHPDYRGHGVGGELFRHAAGWARQRGCRHLIIETQNVNVAACRFYERQGCRLGEAHHFAYAGLPDEVQLLWYKVL
jgi:ribosomal protein S18 acetylase RimI-like enzyme